MIRVEGRDFNGRMLGIRRELDEMGMRYRG
jgi:hypothetical protein